MPRVRPSRCLVAALLTLSALVAACDPQIVLPSQAPLVVFLVRHAEKVSAGSDPALSDAGVARAAALASLLRDSGIEHVHSTDYVRTRHTAGPVAAVLGVPVQLYDGDELRALIAKIKVVGGRHLVVGHSNTTPEAVALLDGEPGTAIDERSEYDRLYVVTTGAGDAVSTVLLRYSTPLP